MAELKEVTIYTDGACSGNPGPGGYGALLIHGERRREMSAGYRLTTNNRMELMAVIAGLEALKFRCKVRLHTDSKYIVDAAAKGWARKWRANNWMRNQKERALNPDLWERLLGLIDEHEVEFIWVRGHAGNAMNELCDRLAVAAAKGPELLVDEVYEKGE